MKNFSINSYENGFLVAGFKKTSVTKLLFEKNLKAEEFYYHYSSLRPTVSSKKRYLSDVNKLIDDINNKEIEKIVYSRVISKPISKSAHTIFENLCSAYPSAFVYLITADGLGTWIGATPETFIDVEGSILKTTALAGTKTDTDTNWGAKEKEEQLLVSDYIENELARSNCINIEKTGPFTFNTGAVYHLKTDFSCEIEEKAIMNLIDNLHPTPATCGLPKHTAMARLMDIEPHERLLYTGFLGPFSLSNVKLFVNLRCMQIIDDEAYLYVGGGITSDSNAELEWEETVNKSKTLLKFLD